MLTGIVGQPSEILKYDFRGCKKARATKYKPTEGIDIRVSGVITPDFKSILGIDPTCGVNLEEKLFECKVGDFKLLYSLPTQIQEKREEDHRAYYINTNIKKRVCVLGSKLDMFINIKGGVKKAVFVLSHCKCFACKKPWVVNTEIPNSRTGTFEFETLSLKPVDMRLRFSHNQEVHDVELKFNPGVVDNFNMHEIESMNDDRSFLAVAYYCSVPLDSLPIIPFKLFVSGGQSDSVSNYSILDELDLESLNTSIEVTQVATVCNIDPENQRRFQQQSSAFKDLYEDKTNMDFVVVSMDMKSFHCHKMILCTRSPSFAAVLANGNVREGREGTIAVVENALATETFIKLIYFQNTGIDDLSFIGWVGALKLSYQHGVMDAVGTCANACLAKTGKLEWEDIKGLWDLYNFIKKRDTLQVIAVLKRSSIMALRRLILARKNKRVRPNEETADDSFNQAFRKYPCLENDLIVDLFKLM
ncbi:unnamed protein product [Orchesella dallaii]|uniref:BTB domain-containing protein n=1 Tax=Orchesella dallaii TaxID=48710 RepID=A0ABP1QMU2_9HEXA